MDPLKVYDYLIRSRGRLFDWTRPLSTEDYTRQIWEGQRSICQTLTHVMIAEWAYLQRIQSLPLPPYDDWPIREEEPPSFGELERIWNQQAERARTALLGVKSWDSELEYLYTDDDGSRMIINASPSDIFTQLVLHEVHHRGQAMLMLRHLGVSLEDNDYNTLMYKRRPAG